MPSSSRLSTGELDPQTRHFALLSRASAALAEARSLSDIKDVRDKAEAVRHYAKSIAMGLEMHNLAAEIKLRAERKAGKLLRSLSLRGGNRKSKCHDDRLKLADLGIDANQSSRWQREAEIPEDVFQTYVEHTTSAKKEISAAGLLAIAKRLKVLDRNLGNSRSASAPLGGHNSSRIFMGDVSIETHTAENNNGIPCPASPLEVIQETKDHLALVAQILTPLCTLGKAELSRAESRHLRSLLGEIEKLLDELTRHVHTTPSC